MREVPQGFYDIKGTWHTSPVRRHSGNPLQIVIMSCPECGRDISLSDRTIAEDGTVEGGVSCKRTGCGWKDDVRLTGWGRLPL